MSNAKCQCGELIQKEFKFCPHCGKSIYDISSWSEFVQNTEFWYEPAMEEYPSVIAHEYWRVRDMLKKGEFFGALWQLKDFYEVLLKYPVLITAAYLYQYDESKDSTREFLWNLFNDKLALGDWVGLGHMAAKILKSHPQRSEPILAALKSILKSTLEMYKNDKITTWRNETLAHGALKLEIDSAFIDEYRKRLESIRKQLEKLHKHYISLVMKFDDGDELRSLTGIKMARDLPWEKGQLLLDDNVSHGECGSLKLEPFMVYHDGGIFFFDSMDEKKQLNELLSYPDGLKKKENNEQILDYKKVLDKIHLRMAKPVAYDSVEGQTRSGQMERWFEKIIQADEHVRPDFLMDWVETVVGSYNKGVFLLQMPAGTGKTTFVRGAVSGEFQRKTAPWRDVQVRACFVNDLWNNRIHDFIAGLSDSLRCDKEGKIEIKGGKLPGVSNMISAAKEIAEYINFIRQAYVDHFGTNKLVIFIDGIDGSPHNAAEGLLSYLPDPAILDDGVYVVFTTRLDRELPRHVMMGLAKIAVTYGQVFDTDDPGYQMYLKKFIPEKVALQSAEGHITPKASALWQWAAIYKSELLANYEELKAANELLEVLKQCYSEKYFRKIKEILCILTWAKEPVTIKELSELLGDKYVTYSLLGLLNDLRFLLRIDHNFRGNLMTLASERFADELWKEIFDGKYNQMATSWFKEYVFKTPMEEIGCFDIGDLLETQKVDFNNDTVSLVMKMLTHCDEPNYYRWMINVAVSQSEDYITKILHNLEVMPKYKVRRLEKIANSVSEQFTIIEVFKAFDQEGKELQNLFPQHALAIRTMRVFVRITANLFYMVAINTMELRRALLLVCFNSVQEAIQCAKEEIAFLEKYDPLDISDIIQNLPQDNENNILNKTIARFYETKSQVNMACCFMKALSYRLLGDVDKANLYLEEFEERIKCLKFMNQKDRDFFLVRLALLETYDGNNCDGINRLREIIQYKESETQEDYFEAVRILGECLYTSGELEAANETFQKCIKNKTGMTDFKRIKVLLIDVYQIVMCYISRGDIAKANSLISSILSQTKTLENYVRDEDNILIATREKLVLLNELYCLQNNVISEEKLTINQIIGMKKLMERKFSESQFAFTEDNFFDWNLYYIAVTLIFLKKIKAYSVDESPTDEETVSQEYVDQIILNDDFWKTLNALSCSENKKMKEICNDGKVSLLNLFILLVGLQIAAAQEKRESATLNDVDKDLRNCLQCCEKVLGQVDSLLSCETEQPGATMIDYSELSLLLIIGMDNKVSLVLALRVMRAVLVRLRSDLLRILGDLDQSKKDKAAALVFAQEMYDIGAFSEQTLKMFDTREKINFVASLMQGEVVPDIQITMWGEENPPLWDDEKDRMIGQENQAFSFGSEITKGTNLVERWWKLTGFSSFGEEILGFGWVAMSKQKAELSLAVSDEHRGCGYGRKILRYLMKECDKMSVSHVDLVVNGSNPNAMIMNKLAYASGFIAKSPYDEQQELNETQAKDFIQQIQKRDVDFTIVYRKYVNLSEGEAG